MDAQSKTTMGSDRIATSNYKYRSTPEQALVNVKTTIQKTVDAVKETLRSMELIERPEVRIKRSLPALPAPER